MNILFITQNYYPRIGGVTRHVQEVTEQLLADGNNVSILVIDGAGHAPFEKDGRKSVYRLKKMFGRTGILFQMLKVFHVFRQARIIHFHDFSIFWKYGIWLFPVLKLLNKKVYLTFHGWEGRCPPEKKIVVKRKICALLADGNMCIGHFIEKWYGTRADVISYGGVKRARELTGAKEHAVFVGRLSEDTGVVEYLKAWKKINSQYPDLPLLICGDGPLKKTLEELVAHENIKNVEFKGFVKDPESYIRNGAIVFTSGYLGILEAFSYKKPVIAAYDNELKKDYLEMLPDGRSVLWIARDCDEISSAVKVALSDNDKVDKAYRFSLENDWERVKSDYYRLWKIDEKTLRSAVGG